MVKYLIEGWIRTELTYPQDIEGYTDSNEYYFANHGKFNPTYVDKNSAIKRMAYSDTETGLTYHVVFGYEEVGVIFTASVSASDGDDRVAIFSSLLAKTVSGYRNLRKFFSDNVSPKETKINFAQGLTHLLIAPYGFLKGLNKKQVDSLIEKAMEKAKEYSANVHLVRKNYKPKKVSKDAPIKIKTMQELLDEAKCDFVDVTVAWGDFYLYVYHYLLRSRFFSFDPSLSVNTIAYGGFVSSLVLQDIHYELKDLGFKMGALRTKIDSTVRNTFPSSVGYFKEELTRLEKTYSIIKSDLRDYTSLSNKIFEGLDADQESKKIFECLRLADSLPDSLFIAENVLDLNRLEYFPSTFEKEMVNLRSDISIIELRFNRSELGITVIVLFSLTTVVSILAYYKIGIGQFADFIQILTFGIALILLLLRVWPRRRSSFDFKNIWRKLKSRVSSTD